MKLIKILVMFAFGLFIHENVKAQDQTPKVDARENVQRARIRQGKRSGELTKEESVKLRAQQRSVRRTERRAKADGSVTPKEQSKLDRKQNRANRSIRRAKHNQKKAQ